VPERYWIATLGCPKNEVDSEKIAGSLERDGYQPARSARDAELLVVNTCAFIDAARAESVEAILELARLRRRGSRLVVTGCLAERSGEELAAALPEVDLVVGLGTPVRLGQVRRGHGARVLRTGGVTDLLELPRARGAAPWAYLKVAEGCSRRCGFCAIPSFRGPQRSRPLEAVLGELEALEALGVAEVILVAQDLASYGRDLGRREGLRELLAAVASRVPRVRLLYLYPSALDDCLIEAIAATGVPYYDLSLQHVSAPLLRRMRRWGSRRRFLERIEAIRRVAPDAALRSSFVVGYPGETEEDHDELLAFLEEAELEWAGFFPFSREEGTYAASLEGVVEEGLALERLREASEVQDRVTARRRRARVGSRLEVLVDAPGVARSFAEAPEIDGVVRVPRELAAGSLVEVVVRDAEGVDLVATPVPGASGRPVRGAPATAVRRDRLLSPAGEVAGR
jgi:ribosomal protein S12 methylthiotransferase